VENSPAGLQEISPVLVLSTGNLNVFLFQGIGSPQFTNLSDRQVIGFAIDANNEPAIFQLRDGVSVCQRDQQPDGFQNSGSPIQNALSNLSSPQVVSWSCAPINKRPVHQRSIYRLDAEHG